VELIKRARKRSASGLVNAVLRKVNRNPVDWPDLQTELCHPRWLLDSWARRFGAETARGIAAANLRMPDTYLRIPAARLSEAGDLAIEKTSVPGCYRLRDGDAGLYRQQDISSQTIVPLLKLEAGQSYLDLCAAPGNKTAQALETPLRAVACDANFTRLVGLRDLPAALVNLDASAPLPFRRQFDRILVDAPCSGTGTIGRNPEIKWRIQPSDPGAHRARQIWLLRRALGALAPGGRVVYATCSLQDEENEDVVRETLEQAPLGVRLEAQLRRTPGVEAGDGFFAASITQAGA
jgi:16S rRNA (cytosine967-C5)-methyltransferase